MVNLDAVAEDEVVLEAVLSARESHSMKRDHLRNAVAVPEEAAQEITKFAITKMESSRTVMTFIASLQHASRGAVVSAAAEFEALVEVAVAAGRQRAHWRSTKSRQTKKLSN